jgi:hypothetical protein
LAEREEKDRATSLEDTAQIPPLCEAPSDEENFSPSMVFNFLKISKPIASILQKFDALTLFPSLFSSGIRR